jgi:hypothetical protein
VIVTTAALEASYQALADWRTAKGVPTTIRTVEWIMANYRRGTDTAETIRFFLQDAYAKWGTKYVLLGGDTGDVPARYLYSAYYYGGTLIPSDLYYSGLDGNFNFDGDERFGEQPADSCDVWPELVVARLPLSTPAAINTVVTKIQRYETPIKTSYTDKVLFLAEVLSPSPWSPPQAIGTNGASYADIVWSGHVDDPSRRTTRMYETDYLYPGSVFETVANAYDSLEAGYNMVYHIGHGYRFNMHCGDGNLAIPEADALFHPDRYFNLFMLNCTAAAFDYDCLGEHLLRNPNGGAVSIIGATNSAFAIPALYHMIDFAKTLYTVGNPHVGDAFNLSKVSRTPLAVGSDGVDLWTHYIYNCLADPEMAIWTGPVKTPVVTVPPSVAAGTHPITVTVTVMGLPQANATVCLWKDGEDYAVGTTDGLGMFTVPFSAAQAGDIGVTVTGTNLKRTATVIPVLAPVGAQLIVDAVTVDDDNNGASAGNGDGVFDAGETVELRPTFRNAGGLPSVAANSTLSCPNPAVTVDTPGLVLPVVAAGATWTPVGATWVVSSLASGSDGTVLRFETETIHAASTWTDGFARALAAPKLEITGLRTSDELPIGNGDGTITSGESFRLWVSVKNYGSGQGYALSGSLTPLNGGSSVTTGAAAFPDLGFLSEAENGASFVMSEANVALENPLEITVTDHEGRTVTRTIELRPPTPPTINSFDASLGLDKLRLTWSASASPDVAGYRVYRSSSELGPFTLASPDIVHHTVFTDGGLTPSTRYFYKTTTIDNAGNESSYSAVASASTNPPQAFGWPNEIPDPSASSAAVGDVDGDGYPEVVVGNDLMYAWNHDGTEVLNGDGIPVTWGIIATEGEDFIGPAALVRLDDDPGLEIVAAAYTSKEVYIFSGKTGDPLPGWPQPTIDFVRGSVAAGDVDGDGLLEIVAVDQDGYLYVWNHDGTEMIDGDANPATTGVFKRLPDTNQWQYQPVALADIDNDLKEEIIIATQDLKLYVFNEDGSDAPNWPRTLPNYPGGGVAVGDIDNNGDLEIVVTVRGSGETYAINHDNTLMWTRWLQHNQFFNPTPSLGDITGDGKLEVIIPTSNGKCYAIQYDGSDVPGWPVTYSTKTYTESSPVIADVDGDNQPDVILGSEERFIYAWTAAGQVIDGFPLVTADAVRGTPVVTDLDLDGDVEVIAVGYDRVVYVWDLTAAHHPDASPWPMFRGNFYRNGLHGFVVATSTPDRPALPAAVALEQNYPNPFNPATTIRYALPAGRNAPTSLVVYDVRGARVRVLVSEEKAPGVHTAVWDGRNDAGVPVGSGVYFYRLSAAGRVETRKMVLLK